MAEEADGMECFDEELLFSEFDAVSNQSKTEYSSCKHEQEQNSTSADLKALKEENYQLKHVLKKLLGEKKDSREKPFFNAIFYNNTISTEGRQKLEFFLHSLLKAQQDSFSGLDPPSENSAIYSNLQPSLIPLNQLKDESESERSNEETHDELQSHHYFSVINCSQYFDAYCVDSCGFPLDNCDPTNSEGWDIPIYEQVFFTALPCDEENSKIRVRRGKACFNCGCIGHNVSDCPEPQNLARVEAKRKEFMNKFSSPFAKFSRYHFDEKRFGAFKPGVISDKLREALGIGDNEVPPYIYKMRMLGYPPGYIPSVNSSTLVLYDADGNVDNYMMEDLDEDDENTRENLFVKYPGFNCSLPHGILQYTLF
jgi:zinc finger CCHC domain-containing protein 8